MTGSELAFTTPILSAAFGALSTAMLCLSYFRRKRHEQRMRRLVGAKVALDMHIEGLNKLDRDDTPDEVLDLALQFSEIISAPLGPMILDGMLQKNPNLFRSRSRQRGDSGQLADLPNKPEIIEALLMTLFGGMKALADRHPETSPALENFMMNFSVSPVSSAEKIVREARVMRAEPMAA